MRKAALVGHREGGTRAAFCSGMYCKSVKRHAKYECGGGEELETRACSYGEFYVGMLECLLHYHERATMPVGQNLCKEMGTEKCPGRLATDQYAEALREAIRCIRIVHGL